MKSGGSYLCDACNFGAAPWLIAVCPCVRSTALLYFVVFFSPRCHDINFPHARSGLQHPRSICSRPVYSRVRRINDLCASVARWQPVAKTIPVPAHGCRVVPTSSGPTYLAKKAAVQAQPARPACLLCQPN